MEFVKHWYKNMSIYSSFGLIIVFLTIGGFIEIKTEGIGFAKIILLISTITTVLFIVTRIIWFKNFKGGELNDKRSK